MYGWDVIENLDSVDSIQSLDHVKFLWLNFMNLEYGYFKVSSLKYGL